MIETEPASTPPTVPSRDDCQHRCGRRRGGSGVRATSNQNAKEPLPDIVGYSRESKGIMYLYIYIYINNIHICMYTCIK